MVQKIHPRGVIGVPNSGPYVKRFQIRVLLSEGSILEPSLSNNKQPLCFLYCMSSGTISVTANKFEKDVFYPQWNCLNPGKCVF